MRRPQKDLDLLDPESPHHRQSPSSWPSSLQSSGSTGLLFISHQSVGFAVSAPGDYSRPCNSCMGSTRGSASVVCSSCCSLCCSLMFFQEIVLEKITDGANMKAGAVLLSLAVMFFRQASGRLWSASHPSPSSAGGSLARRWCRFSSKWVPWALWVTCPAGLGCWLVRGPSWEGGRRTNGFAFPHLPSSACPMSAEPVEAQWVGAEG